MEEIVNSEELNYLKKIGVNYLVHFTPARNLESILRHGICPRQYMDKHDIRYRYTDESRFDGKNGYTSFSFSFPNRGMLLNKMIENEMSFLALFIDVKVIGLIDSDRIIYSPSNAAKHDAVWGNGLQYLESMFSNEVTDTDGIVHTRRELNLPNNFTTDPQAEVLIHCIIPPEYIKICATVPYENEDLSWVPKTIANKELNIKVASQSIVLDEREMFKSWWSLKTL